jgi:hypothetical protein
MICVFNRPSLALPVEGEGTGNDVSLDWREDPKE